MVFEIDISNDQANLLIDEDALRQAVIHALRIERVHSAVLSISIVDNAAIHQINRDHLQHDCPTDVISFQLDFSMPLDDDDELESDDPQGDDRAKDEETDGEDDADENDEASAAVSGGSALSGPEQPASAQPASELRAAGALIEGEIVASAQMAMEMADEVSGPALWTAANELTLYVIHGLLHICGYDDMSPTEKRLMRSRERAVLNSMGLHPAYPGDDCA